MSQYLVPDPWPSRLREAFHRNITCRLLGHKNYTKFGGTVLCRRHS